VSTREHVTAGGPPGAAYPDHLRAEVEAYLAGLTFAREPAAAGPTSLFRPPKGPWTMKPVCFSMIAYLVAAISHDSPPLFATAEPRRGETFRTTRLWHPQNSIRPAP
jgi:hypothetical protein